MSAGDMPIEKSLQPGGRGRHALVTRLRGRDVSGLDRQVAERLVEQRLEVLGGLALPFRPLEPEE